MESASSLEHPPKDISKEFSDMKLFDFLDFVRTLRREPQLHITADLSTLDRDQYIGQARRLKGFLEGRPDGQNCSATIRGAKEQRYWESNVTASGVKWEEV